MTQTSPLLTGLDAQQVWNMGVDEAMVLCKKFKALSDAFPDDWCPPDEDGDTDEEEEEVNEEACSQEMCDHTGGSQTGTDKEWEVEEIYNVRVCDEAVRKAKGEIQLRHLMLPESPLFNTVWLSDLDLPCCCTLSSPEGSVAVRLKCE